MKELIVTTLVVVAGSAVALAAPQSVGTVKSKQKISATAGGFGGVLADGVFFASSMSALGDLDGDGIGDLAVGEPDDSDGGAAQGAVWILFLNTDGTVKAQQKISATAGGFGGALHPFDHFGYSVSGLGDLDGDGIRDLAVGAYLDDDGGSAKGAVWILFLNANGTVRSQQKISATAGGFGGALDPLDYFGYSLSSLGDLDGDGIGDLAVGAVLDDDGASDQGAVWILFLHADGTVRSQQKISETAGGFGGALSSGDEFGGSVASLGDLDGDGIGDLAVGADADDDGGMNKGAVWILLLNADGTVRSEQKISAGAGGFGTGLHPNDLFGVSVSSLGDLDSDGIGDLAVGALFDDDGGTNRGATWILFLNVDGTVRSKQKISGTAGGFGAGLDPGDNFGSSVSALGDLDGDGIGDLAVGARFDDDGGSDRGAVWVLFLEGDTIPPTISCPPLVSVIDPKNGAPGETVFFSVTASDDHDPAPSVLCVPPSGSFFPAGTTIVTCTATDASGNQSVATFPVVVMPTIRKHRL